MSPAPHSTMLSRMRRLQMGRLLTRALLATTLLTAATCRQEDGPYPSKELKLIVRLGYVLGAFIGVVIATMNALFF